MKEQKRQGTFAGVGVWIVERDGQELAHRGDRVQVKATVGFPIKESYLESYICFGVRVILMGEYLYGSWGKCDSVNTSIRTKSEFFIADTWEGCFSAALAFLSKEEAVLQKAIDVRKQALIDAENPASEVVAEYGPDDDANTAEDDDEPEDDDND